MDQVRRRILCVDDEPYNLELLEAVLGPRGFTVVKAADGRKALDIIRTSKIDIVLLDVMMPGMNGFEVCRVVKEDERLRSLPVIMLTALSSTEDRIRGIEAGAEDFITKPFDKDEVLARIRMLLKVRDLNERLNSAFNSITNLTSFSKSVITAFNPMDFDFMFAVEGIVGQIIRRDEQTPGRPEIVIVGIRERDACRLFLYASVSESGRVSGTPVGRDFPHCLLGAESSAPSILFLNQPDLEQAEPYGFLQLIVRDRLRIENLVAYQSRELSIFALNYGRTVTGHDAAVLNSIVIQTLFLRSLSSQVRETEDAFTYTVFALARASEANDEDTGNHILRVGEYCAILAHRLGLGDKFIKAIRTQAPLHDIGKIHTPAHILKKPSSLTGEEWHEMKQHTISGARIIGDHQRFTVGRNISLTHHEKWDGSGYPRGLKGEEIPIEGRITAIADIYDALRNPRVYKPAFDHATAFSIITEGDGRVEPAHFDPQVLRAFREISSPFKEVYENLKG